MSNFYIEVKRDSVCMGDDVDAPHLLQFEVKTDALIEDLFKQLASRNYLATVAGKNHYWEAIIDDIVVAKILGNNQKPECSDQLKEPLSKFVQEGYIRLNYKYYSAKS